MSRGKWIWRRKKKHIHTPGINQTTSNEIKLDWSGLILLWARALIQFNRVCITREHTAYTYNFALYVNKAIKCKIAYTSSELRAMIQITLQLSPLFLYFCLSLTWLCTYYVVFCGTDQTFINTLGYCKFFMSANTRRKEMIQLIAAR